MPPFSAACKETNRYKDCQQRRASRLAAIIRDGITIAWREFQQTKVGDGFGGDAIWDQFEYQEMRRPDLDLAEIDVREHAAVLTARLDGFTADQQAAVAELLFPAINTAGRFVPTLGRTDVKTIAAARKELTRLGWTGFN